MAVYEVVLNGMLEGQPMLHVLHYDITGSSDFQLFADAIRTEITNGLSAALVPAAIYTGITVREDIPGAVGVGYLFSSGQIGGTNTATTYAANLAALVRKFADSNVNPNQGRLYQGGIPASALNSDGYLLAGYIGSMIAAWENLRVIEFDVAGEGVMQIKASNPTAPNTVPYNTVARIGCRNSLSTQKRRNFGT